MRGVQMDKSWLNVISLLLGLISWAIPLVIIIRPIDRFKHLLTLIFLSLAAISLALLGQISSLAYLTEIGDFSALEDIMTGVEFGAIVLISLSFILNGVVIYRFNKKESVK